MIRRALLAGGLLVFITAGAGAELPPHAYEQARAEAAAVVLLEVEQVGGPGRRNVGSGLCRIVGRVVAVERGSARVGDRVVYLTDCLTSRYKPMPGPFPGYRVDYLRSQKRLKLWVNGDRVIARGIEEVPVQ